MLTFLAAAGLAAAVVGLWLALRAAAGAPGQVNYQAVTDQYGGVRQFEISCAKRASEALRWAKLSVATSLMLIAAAVFASWWAPPKPANPPAKVKVTLDQKAVCGVLLSADQNQFRVQVDGESIPVTIPFAETKNLRLVSSC